MTTQHPNAMKMPDRIWLAPAKKGHELRYASANNTVMEKSFGKDYEYILASSLPKDKDEQFDALVEALEFYAEPDHYVATAGEKSLMDRDGGRTAQSSLTRIRGGK